MSVCLDGIQVTRKKNTTLPNDENTRQPLDAYSIQFAYEEKKRNIYLEFIYYKIYVRNLRESDTANAGISTSIIMYGYFDLSEITSMHFNILAKLICMNRMMKMPMAMILLLGLHRYCRQTHQIIYQFRVST